MHIAVIGGGPGGYVAAIRLAQLGATVTIIEKKKLGGTCLNVGCIPTKVLAHSSELLHEMKHAGSYGLEVSGVSINWPQLQERKETIVKQLVDGVETLLTSYGIEIKYATASFVNQNQLMLEDHEGIQQLMTFDKAVIATGSESIQLPIPGAQHPEILTSTEALSLPHIPESLCIIGGGVIGMEFAGIYAEMGANVTVIEMLPGILATMDTELSAMMREIMEAEGVTIHTDTKVQKIEKTADGFTVQADNLGELIHVDAEKVLIAAGRKPTTAALKPENAGISTDRERIITDQHLTTSQKHIYAIGDCIGGSMLAHTASAQGVAVAENMMGHYNDMKFDAIPSCVYIRPEYASVGMTAETAQAKGHNVKTGIFPLHGNAKALIINNGMGVVKFVADADTDEILGLHILGPRATDLIIEGTLAIRLEATLKEISTTIHPHPTLTEAILEAAHAAQGHCIHMPAKA